jgi:hypothetical protein
MQRLYLPREPGLTEAYNILDALINRELPSLAAHFTREKIEPSAYARAWFLSGFVYTLPFALAIRIWVSTARSKSRIPIDGS